MEALEGCQGRRTPTWGRTPGRRCASGADRRAERRPQAAGPGRCARPGRRPADRKDRCTAEPKPHWAALRCGSGPRPECTTGKEDMNVPRWLVAVFEGEYFVLTFGFTVFTIGYVWLTRGDWRRSTAGQILVSLGAS